MTELIELDLGGFHWNEKSNMIFNLEKIESLKISSLKHTELLQKLPKLKTLHVASDLSIERLHDIVQFVPTLSELALSFNVDNFDKKALEILIE